MNAAQKYFDVLAQTLEKVRDTQFEKIERAARELADANADGRSVFAFGCNHAMIVALELFYRAGGMVTINPIRAPGMMLELTPITMTSEMERMEGYGRTILDNTPAKSGDVLLIHSVSGRNPVAIDMALRARELGIFTICITNMATSSAMPSRHSTGQNLYECSDLVIDNCGCLGDASVEIEGLSVKTAPTSSAIGTAIVNAISALAIELSVQEGRMPPVFLSANLPGGDEHNKKVMEFYKNNIFYM